MATDLRTVKSVERTTEIITELRILGGGTVTELAERTDLSIGSIHSHLSTLRDAGYVVKNGKTYDLGPRLLTLGEYVRNHSELYKASKPQIEELATQTGECAHLIIKHESKLFALYERFGSNAVGVEYHDRKREKPLSHLHCTAAGKSILATLSHEQVAAIASETGLSQSTRNTITDEEQLFQELEDVRDKGYAIADEEQMEGIRAVGAAIEGTDRKAVGAVALSGPTARFVDDQFQEEFPERVMRAANICEVNLRTIKEDQYDI